jgi:methyl-accepting chemotaxis protein
MAWTIGKKLYGSVGGIVLLLALLAFASLQATDHLNDAVSDLERVAHNLERTGEIGVHVGHLRTEARNAVIAAARQDTQAVSVASAAAKEAGKAIVALSGELAAHADDEKVRAVTAVLPRHVREWEAAADELWAAASNLRPAEAAQVLDRLLPIGKKIEQEAAEIEKLEKEALSHSEATAEAVARAARWQLLAAVSLALLVAAAAFYVVHGLTRELMGIAVEVKQGAMQVASASSQVSGASQALSQGATEQAASLEETSASMEEMSSMTRQNASSSQQAARLMGEADALMGGAGTSLSQMVSSMQAIRESSERVSKIIKTVDEIAFQTNILALNAAVEAARAGDAGMGFAVVADEVRSLAQRAAQAARDTAGLIEESSASALSGQRMVEQLATGIRDANASLSSVKQIVEQVRDASGQQAQGIAQVSQAVAQMEQVTQTTAASAEEGAAASEELSAQAVMTLTVVRRLEAMLTGQSDETDRAASAVPAHTAPARVVALAEKRRPQISTVTRAAATQPLEDTGTFGSF